MEKVYKTNLILKDYDEYGFQDGIIEVSIGEKDYRKFAKKVEEAKKIGIDTFEIDVFDCDIYNGIKEYDEDLLYNEDTNEVDDYTTADLSIFKNSDTKCEFETFFFEYGEVHLKTSFKYTSGNYQSEDGITIQELDAFFGSESDNVDTSSKNKQPELVGMMCEMVLRNLNFKEQMLEAGYSQEEVNSVISFAGEYFSQRKAG